MNLGVKGCDEGLLTSAAWRSSLQLPLRLPVTSPALDGGDHNQGFLF